MKKILPLIPLIAITQLFAITQNDAIKLYNSKQYQKAYNAFLILLEKNNYKSNVLNFYFAKSAEKIGNYKEALGAIQRILINYPNDLLAQYERAKIYFLLKEYKSAKQFFDKLIKQIKDKKIKSEINKYLLAIQNQQKTNFLSTTLIVSLGYDSNINNTTESSKWNLYIDKTKLEVNNAQQIQNSYTNEEVLFSKYMHKFENFKASNGFLLLSKQYTASHNKDILYLKDSPSFIINNDNFQSETKLNYGYLIYGHNPYLSIFGIKETIKYIYNPTILNTTNLKIDIKTYKDNINSNKNSTLSSIKNKTEKIIDNHLFSILFGFEHNEKHKSTLSNITYDNYLTSWGYKYKFAHKVTLSSNIMYEYKKYKDEYKLFNTHQLDKKTTFNISLTKKLKLFDIQTSYTYIKNNSNIAPFDYNKWTLNFSLIKTIKGL